MSTQISQTNLFFRAQGLFWHHKQQGAVLVTTVMILLVLTILGLVAMRDSILQERMAGNSRMRSVVYQMAESGIREGEIATYKSKVDQNGDIKIPEDFNLCKDTGKGSLLNLSYSEDPFQKNAKGQYQLVPVYCQEISSGGGTQSWLFYEVLSCGQSSEVKIPLKSTTRIRVEHCPSQLSAKRGADFNSW